MAALSRESIVRVIASLVAAERARQGSGAAWDCVGWSEDRRFDASGLGCDSLELWACASEVSRFFRLHVTGDADGLAGRQTLGAWCDTVQSAMARAGGEITFATSGTTGLPKLIRQDLATLQGEVAHWGVRLAGASRIVQTVAGHHIYGFLFAILLPELTAKPVYDARMLPPAALCGILRPGDLLVAHPALLKLLAAESEPFPDGLTIVSATSTLDEALHAALYRQGAGKVLDVYGSSETAGIAERTEPGAAFALLPRWQRAPCGTRLIDAASGRVYALPDHADWTDERHLKPADRVDGAVQVSGVNVYPQHIAAILRKHDMVADCDVWLDNTLPLPRLKARITPKPGLDGAEAAARCEAWARKRLTAPERPVCVVA